MKELVGHEILRARRKMGLTQVELADRLGVAQRTVSRWERGECAPKWPDVPFVAKVLGLTVSELMGRHGDSLQQAS